MVMIIAYISLPSLSRFLQAPDSDDLSLHAFQLQCTSTERYRTPPTCKYLTVKMIFIGSNLKVYYSNWTFLCQLSFLMRQHVRLFQIVRTHYQKGEKASTLRLVNSILFCVFNKSLPPRKIFECICWLWERVEEIIQTVINKLDLMTEIKHYMISFYRVCMRRKLPIYCGFKLNDWWIDLTPKSVIKQ